MMRGLAILFLLGAVVYAVPRIDQYVNSPATRDAADRARAADEARTTANPSTVRLHADDRGHFHANASINGRSIELLADTGASAIALTENDARRAGFDARTLDFDIPVQTANGTIMVASVMLDRVEVGGIVLHDVRAVVAKHEGLAESLLGMTFLGRLASVKMSGDTLELVK